MTTYSFIISVRLIYILGFRDGKLNTKLSLNSVTTGNIQTPTKEMDEFVSSDLPRNPPIWVTNQNSELFLNDARVVKRDLLVRIGSEHVVHTLDRVLIPTVPNTASGGSDLHNPDGKKFMSAASAYNISGGYQIS